MLKILLGVPAAFMGIWLIILPYGLAGMGASQFQGPKYWAELLRQYRIHGDLWVVTGLAMMLVAGGVSLCVNAPRRVMAADRPTWRPRGHGHAGQHPKRESLTKGLTSPPKAPDLL